MSGVAISRARGAIAAGRLDVAEQLVRAILRAKPEDASAVHLLGVIAQRRGAVDDADRLFAQASSLAPDWLEPRLNIAGLFHRTGRTDQALVTLDEILATDPAQPGALSLKAVVLAQKPDADAADAAFQALTMHHPRDGGGWLNYGHFLRSSGRADDAAAAYRRAIAVSTRPGIAWWGLANLKSLRFDERDVAAMRAALGGCDDHDDRIHLHFALGRALDDLGEPAAAFNSLRRGNALRLSKAPHDAAASSQGFRRAAALFSPEFIASRAGSGAAAPDPIFIVGMPRSGSTLVEQILASHPLVEGTDELHDMHHIARQVAQAGGGYADGLATLSAAALRDMGEQYLQATRRHRATSRPFFTDKMPSNWIYTGLIRLALPNARIIDVRRHPMACGFANFAQHYSWGNNFAYDLAGIGRFYTDYVRHMAHFDRVDPGSIHRIHLETIVDDLEGEVRRLLDYLGLPFDTACLRFHDTARAVHTPSALQVRRPVSREGSERWRSYAQWLEPLRSELGPVLEHYPLPPPEFS